MQEHFGEEANLKLLSNLILKKVTFFSTLFTVNCTMQHCDFKVACDIFFLSFYCLLSISLTGKVLPVVNCYNSNNDSNFFRFLFFYLQIQVTQFLIELISCDLTSIFKITLSIEP